MAISNLPPPQAYTKEILAEAYAWLTNQHDNIKKRATNADSLIAMYLRHKRTGLEEKVNVEEFKSELKNLAGMMDHFSPQESVARQSAPQSSQISNQHPSHFIKEDMRNLQKPVQKPVDDGFDGMDKKTHMMLYEVKMRLNLSSEQEALRMLVRLGFRQIKSLLPEDELL